MRRGEADSDFDEYWLQEQRATDLIVDDREYLDGLDEDDDLVNKITPDETEQTSRRSSSSTVEVGTGPDVDVEVSDRRQLHGVTDSDAVAPGISLVDPKGQLSMAGRTYRDVSPRTSEWLADVLKDIIPSTARLVQDLAYDHPEGVDPMDPAKTNYEVTRFVTTVLVEEVAQLDDVHADMGAIEEARSYLEAIGRYSLLWADDVYRVRRGFQGKKRFELVQRTLETTGTSHGQFNAGVEALRHSLCALHAERDVPLPLTFVLAGDDWTAADRETVKRALTAFDVLADGFDVRLWISQGLRQRIRRLVNHALDTNGETDPPSWAERFEFLTDGGRTSRRSDDVENSQKREEARQFIDEYSTKTGLLTLLAHLDKDESRSVRAIKRDDVIDYADGSIDSYLPKLESEGMVEIDRSHASNRVSLSALGAVTQDYVDEDGNVVYRHKSRRLGESYGHPSASHKYSVTPQETGQDPHSPAERWMADTGDPTEDGYVQWLGDATGPRKFEPPVMHRRISAGERVSGVNFTDTNHLDWTNDDQAPNGDGRVTYTSIFDDHALLVSQWGGAPNTLARLCSGLLGNRMLSKALNIDAVGTQFENVHDGIESFNNDIHDVLTRAHQIGWLGEDELEHYDNWRDRIGTVRSQVLSRVAQLDDMDSGLRSELFRDLQGLLASATHLYYAAGIEVTFNIRIPRVKELLANDEALQEFLDFTRFTLPKQAGYEDSNGFHSWYRMCIEDRPDKLKARSSYAFDRDQTADLTASWILSGPEVSSLREHVQEAVNKESNRLRERVEEGVEDAATLDIPMVEVNSHAHIRGLVRGIAERKGFYEGNRQDLDRLTRVLDAALSTSNRGPDPFLVADALDSLQSRDTPRDRLDTWSVQNALSSLPPDAIFPTLPPSARRMLSALFSSDDPLNRQDLIEITSESSYDRHHKTLRAFFLVEETDEGFVGHLEPWWSSTVDERTPFDEPHPTPQPQPPHGYIKQPRPPASPGALIIEIIAETEHLDIPPDRYYEFGKRINDIEWLLEELGLRQWRPILRAYCDNWSSDSNQSYSDPPRVTIAGHEPVSTGRQSTLSDHTHQIS
jgi:hypothetical protein